MKNILIGILLLISGLAYSQSSSSGTLANGSSGVTGGFQVYYLTNLSDTTTLISPRKNESLFITSNNKFYKRTSYWALQATIATSGGTVTSVSVVSANGLSGTVATATTTPAITLSTTITGLLKGNGTAISAATPSTDYTIPADLTVYLTTSTAASTYMPLTGYAFTTTTGIGHELTSSTLTSGTLFKLTGTSTANLTGAKMFEISSSGANSNSSVTKYGIYSSVTNTGTSSTNVAGYFAASGGTNNYALQSVGGNGGGFKFGDLNSTTGAIWSSNITPSGVNYLLASDGSTNLINGAGQTVVQVVGVTKLAVAALTSTFSNNLIVNSTVSTGSGATAGFQFNANSLTSGVGIDASTSSLTTGMLAQFQSTSTALSGTNSCVQKIMSSGANSNASAQATGLNIAVSNTGTTSTNIAASFTASGASTNYALQTSGKIDATAGTYNFSTNVTSGQGTNSGFNLTANSLTNGVGANFTSSSITSGALMAITSTSTAAASSTLRGLDLSISGANSNVAQTVTGINVAVSNTNATSGTNVAATFSASGATTANYGLLVPSGSVGIGTSTPVAILEVKGANTIDGLRVSLTGSTPFLARFFNTSYSTTSSVFEYFAFNVGEFRMGSSSASSVGIYTNSNYSTPSVYIKSGGDVGIGGNAGGVSLNTMNKPTLTAFSGVYTPSSGSAAFSGVSIATSHSATNSTSGAYKPLNITYTINNTGTASTATATGIFLNATTTALNGMSHNLMDLQVGSTSLHKVDGAGKILISNTITTGGTTGNQTINKPSGTVNIAAAGTTVTVTNSTCTTSSIVYAVIRTNDATAYIKNVVPGSGTFDINLGAAATGEISIGFVVFN